MLNRDQRTIWVTYRNSCTKRSAPLPVSDSKFQIPLSALNDRRLSVLESIVFYLKQNHKLRYSEIAGLIKRDERNIWSVYHKAEKKIKDEQGN